MALVLGMTASAQADGVSLGETFEIDLIDGARIEEVGNQLASRISRISVKTWR